MSDLAAAVGRAADLVGRIVDDPTEHGLAAAVAADPGSLDALFAVLRDRFVERGEGFGDLEGDDTFWRIIAIALTTWAPALRERFAAEVLFKAAAPDAYRWIAPLARALYRADAAERLVLAAVERGDAATRVNASHLAYYLFDGSPEYALSDIGARRLADADPLRSPRAADGD
ncbi:MAG: hypothetical protein U1F43_02310 [Myxococcota bacterium]